MTSSLAPRTSTIYKSNWNGKETKNQTEINDATQGGYYVAKCLPREEYRIPREIHSNLVESKQVSMKINF